jgi:hypothetical protein
MNLLFKDQKHQEAYEKLLEEADLTHSEWEKKTELIRRQLAFFYLIALFQEDYRHYEGEAFYVEAYEEISLGGPTYLLEDCIGEGNYSHEQILFIAKELLQGKIAQVPTALEHYSPFIKEAFRLVQYISS